MVKTTGKIILFISLLLSQVAFSQGFQVATANLGIETQLNHLHELKKLNVKLIRYPILLSFGKSIEVLASDAKVYINEAERLDIDIIVVLAHPNRTPPSNNWWNEITFKQLREDWVYLARELKPFKCRFDFLNEPKKELNGLSLFNIYSRLTTASRRIKRSRKHSYHIPSIRIADLVRFNPLKIRGINLSRDYVQVHAYDFFNYVFGYNLYQTINIKKRFKVIKDFKEKYNIQVYLGELTIRSNHPDCAYYMQTSINEIKKLKIPYTVHAYRESEWWDYELNPDCFNSIINNFK